MRSRQRASPRRTFSKTPTSSFSIPAISARKAAEKVYSELGAYPAGARSAPQKRRRLHHRGCRLRGAGRRRGTGPPRARRRHCGRTAKLSPAARPSEAASEKPRSRHRNRVSRRREVRDAARAETSRAGFCVPHGAGRLRQVLHILRRALHQGRRIFAARRANPRRSEAACRARREGDHAARAERERLSRRRSIRENLGLGAASRRAVECRGHRAASFHDKPSERDDRRAHRRPSRPAQADALSASAIPGGLRPYPQSDESQAHDGRLFPHRGKAQGARGRIWRFRRTSLWAFRAKATPISRRRCASSRR